MDVVTRPVVTQVSLDVVATRSVQSASTSNVVQINRQPAYADVSKVYGPPGAKGDKGDAGPPGAQGQPGRDGASASATTYPFLLASTLWIVNHNSGSYPIVSVFTQGGVEVEAEILNTSLNQTRILFTQPTAGFARLS